MSEMTPAEEVEMIEISMEAAKEKVALGNAMQRLLKNKDFKKVFIEHFLEKEIARTVKLMAAPAFQESNQQEMLNKMLIAVGQVDQFIRTTITLGHMAAESIVDSEAECESLLQGEV